MFSDGVLKLTNNSDVTASRNFSCDTSGASDIPLTDAIVEFSEKGETKETVIPQTYDMHLSNL